MRRRCQKNKANAPIADCRNDTGQPASAFGGVVGLRIGGQTFRLRPAQANCAKQTQFPSHGRDARGTHGRDAHATSAWRRPSNRPSAPNKANLRTGRRDDKCCGYKELGQMGRGSSPGKTKPKGCGQWTVAQTKPIRGSRALAPVVLMGRMPMPRAAGGGAANRASAPNKANFGRGEMEGKCCADKELRQMGRGRGFGKTKPISGRAGSDGAGRRGRRSCTNKANLPMRTRTLNGR